MTDNQKAYIGQLSEKLKCLDEKIETLKGEDAIPFSFYRESFGTTQEITRLLHEMELFQIDEMKSEMGKLIAHLAESQNGTGMYADSETEVAAANDDDLPTGDDDEGGGNDECEEDEDPDEIMETRIGEEAAAEQPDERNIYVDDVSLPNFNRSSAGGNLEQPKTKAVIDIKQLLTLNDRYLFQRELFHNSRTKMENFILILNTFDNFDEARKYMGDNTTWDFDDETVKSFTTIVQKGFE